MAPVSRFIFGAGLTVTLRRRCDGYILGAVSVGFVSAPVSALIVTVWSIPYKHARYTPPVTIFRIDFLLNMETWEHGVVGGPHRDSGGHGNMSSISLRRRFGRRFHRPPLTRKPALKFVRACVLSRVLVRCTCLLRVRLQEVGTGLVRRRSTQSNRNSSKPGVARHHKCTHVTGHFFFLISRQKSSTDVAGQLYTHRHV